MGIRERRGTGRVVKADCNLGDLGAGRWRGKPRSEPGGGRAPRGDSSLCRCRPCRFLCGPCTEGDFRDSIQLREPLKRQPQSERTPTRPARTPWPGRHRLPRRHRKEHVSHRALREPRARLPCLCARGSARRKSLSRLAAALCAWPSDEAAVTRTGSGVRLPGSEPRLRQVLAAGQPLNLSPFRVSIGQRGTSSSPNGESCFAY